MVFEEIRRVIEEKEREIISTIQRSLEKEELYLMNRYTANQEQRDLIQKFEKEFNISGSEEEIALLTKAENRK